MKADELKSLQAPLKQRYRDKPESALVTLRAEARLGEDVTCRIETGKARVEVGLHPATGGNGVKPDFHARLSGFNSAGDIFSEPRFGPQRYQCRLRFVAIPLFKWRLQ